MLMPKRVKYRKQQRGRMNGKAYRGSSVVFGEFGLQALEPAWITNRQIEAARVAITRSIKRGGKMWIRVFPDKPVTKKPAETRMGKGKGAPEFWVAVVKASAMREMTVDEIRERVTELRAELFNLRFRNSMKQLDNPIKIRESRREMARLLTVLNEKESAKAAS